mmetsp:Transcript_28492/g.72996  ORF Transcript_28492/g.72996 Transcript_28492/m.72996 type:complete len:227 (+) Transcript_28492:364-1044(+)
MAWSLHSCRRACRRPVDGMAKRRTANPIGNTLSIWLPAFCFWETQSAGPPALIRSINAHPCVYSALCWYMPICPSGFIRPPPGETATPRHLFDHAAAAAVLAAGAAGARRSLRTLHRHLLPFALRPCDGMHDSSSWRRGARRGGGADGRRVRRRVRERAHVVYCTLHLVDACNLDEGCVECRMRERARLDTRHAFAQPIARPVDTLAEGFVAEKLVHHRAPLCVIE